MIFLSGFNENLILSTNFRKIKNIKFHENPFIGSQTVSCGRTDRQTDGNDECNIPYSQFCDRAEVEKVSPSSRHEGTWGRRGIPPLILNLGTRWR